MKRRRVSLPELPEVETVRRALDKLVVGATVDSVEVRWPKIINYDAHGGVEAFQLDMVGQTLRGMKRRGKYLIFEWDDFGWISHLRMEGKFLVVSHDEPIDKHTHVIFNLTDGRDLRYRDVRKFGRIQMFPKQEIVKGVAALKLGPEPENLTANYLKNKFARTHRLIKPVLLDQKILAGLGNIYADEVLYLSKIHPMQPADTLTADEIALLTVNVKKVLSSATAKGGTTIRSYTDSYGEAGHFQVELLAYGKNGQPCGYCGEVIEKMKVAQRGTHYCPHCQVLHG